MCLPFSGDLCAEEAAPDGATDGNGVGEGEGADDEGDNRVEADDGSEVDAGNTGGEEYRGPDGAAGCFGVRDL